MSAPILANTDPVKLARAYYPSATLIEMATVLVDVGEPVQFARMTASTLIENHAQLIGDVFALLVHVGQVTEQGPTLIPVYVLPAPDTLPPFGVSSPPSVGKMVAWVRASRADIELAVRDLVTRRAAPAIVIPRRR